MALTLTDPNSVIPSLKCSNCGKKIVKNYGWLKSNDHFVCNCGARTEWKPNQFLDVVKGITEERAKVINKIRRALKG